MSEVKEKRYDANGIEMVASNKEIYGDACGQVGINCVNQVLNNATYFYTDKVGMAAGSTGIIQAIAIIGDAISDLTMGKLLDRTNTKDGKCRPWIKRMLLPTFLAMMMLVCVPHIAAGGQLAWAIVSQIFARAIVLTALNLAYTALLNYMTQSLAERGKFGAIRAIFGNSSGCVINMILIPVTNLLGGDQRAWIIFTAVMGAIAVLLLFICYKSTTERFQNATGESGKDEDADLSLAETFKILIHNKYWIFTVLGYLFMMMFFVLQGGAQAYYCKWILGNDNLVFVVNLVALAFMFLAFFTVPMIVSRFSMRTAGLIGLGIALVCNAIRMVFPTNFYSFVIGFGVELYGVNITGAILTPMILNTTELNDYNYGHRVTGMTSSSVSFLGKLSMAAASSMVGVILGMTGYDPTAATQSSTAIFGICALNIHLHFAVLIVVAVFVFLYDFEKHYPRLLKANTERRAKAAAEQAKQ